MFTDGVVEIDRSDELREWIRRRNADNSVNDELHDHAKLLRCSDLDRARSEVELARRIATVAGSGSYRDDGHTTVGAWCRAERRWSEAETRARIRLGKLLAAHPDLDEEILGGRLGVAQAHTLAKAAANPRCGDQIGDSLPLFLEYADAMPHADFQRLVAHWERIADADGAHRDADRSHQQRRASWGTDDDSGDFSLHLRCGAAQGAQIRAVIDTFATAEFTADWAACVAAHGDNAVPALMRRTDAQRRADAIVAMAVVAASTPAGSQRPEPLVNLVVDEATLTAFLREQAGTGTAHAHTRADHPDDRNVPDARHPDAGTDPDACDPFHDHDHDHDHDTTTATTFTTAVMASTTFTTEVMASTTPAMVVATSRRCGRHHQLGGDGAVVRRRTGIRSRSPTLWRRCSSAGSVSW